MFTLKDWYQIMKPPNSLLFISILNLLSSNSTVITSIASLLMILENSNQKLMKLNFELIHVPSMEITCLTRFESHVLIFRCFLISVINWLFSEHFESFHGARFLNYSLRHVVSCALSYAWSIQAKPISKQISFICAIIICVGVFP